MSDSKKTTADKGKLYYEVDLKGDNGLGANYPSTNRDKADETHFHVHLALERISAALWRTERFSHLLSLKDIPSIIAHNEARMALEKIDCVIAELEDAKKMALEVWESTKDFSKGVTASEQD